MEFFFLPINIVKVEDGHLLEESIKIVETKMLDYFGLVEKTGYDIMGMDQETM